MMLKDKIAVNLLIDLATILLEEQLAKAGTELRDEEPLPPDDDNRGGNIVPDDPAQPAG